MQHVNTVVINDPTRLSSLNGISPELNTFQKIVDHLKDVLEKRKFKQVITVGNSGGAHTAILLGYLLKVDYVVAFAPYPYMSVAEGIKRKDPAIKSMQKIIQGINNLPNEVQKYLNVNHLLKE